MLISLSGRSGCGKTVIANFLVKKYGFKKISFADPLKELVSKIFSIKLEDLKNPKTKDLLLVNELQWNEVYEKKLSLEIQKKIYLPEFYSRKFNSYRQLLQFIGTDILRNVEPFFHINKIKKKILSHERIVIDDCRFFNEKEFVEKHKGIPIFLIRSVNQNYTNHVSEISLSFKDFSNVIINDRNFSCLFNRIILFIESKTNLIAKEKLRKAMRSTNFNIVLTAKKLKVSKSLVQKDCNRFLIPTLNSKYFHDIDSFTRINKQESYWAGLLSADGCLKKSKIANFVIELVSKDFELVEGFRNFLKTDKPYYVIREKYYSICLASTFLIENLKRWEIKQRKSRVNVIPPCIINDNNCLKCWVKGLIDGDGSIYFITKTKQLEIAILASKEIVEFICKWCPIKAYIEKNHKGVENLWQLKFHGKNAIKLAYFLGNEKFGLARKWDKIKQYEEWLRNNPELCKNLSWYKDFIAGNFRKKMKPIPYNYA